MKLALKILKYAAAGFFFFIILALIIRASLLAPNIWLTSIAGQQTFGIAVDISTHPFEKDTYLVSDKVGKVYKFKEGSNTKQLVLDISEKVKSDSTEEGLLATEIDPQRPDTVYVYYSHAYEINHLSRFKILEDGSFDKASEKIILTVEKAHTGHNAGDMRFGKDGMFWMSVGEASYAAKGRALELDKSIQGTIIRIDVRDQETYAIPQDNPHVGNTEGIPEEVWASGFRNPWRWSFKDEAQTEILAGDVGKRTYEEIAIVKAGEHAGWPYMEGKKCHIKEFCQKDFRKPMTFFSRDVLRSVTGGYVYRGERVDALKGKYVFGDYLRGIMTLPVENPPQFVEQVYSSGFSYAFPKIPMPFGPEKGFTIHPVSFHEDANRELLVVALNGGIFRIEPIDLWTRIKGFLYIFGSFR